MNYKSSKTTIKIKLLGAGITPETVRAVDLAEFIANIDKAIMEMAVAKGIMSPETADAEAYVSLVDIDLGSDLLIFAVSDRVVSAVSEVTHAVSSNDYSGVPIGSHDSLYAISRQATKKRWAVEFTPDKDLGIAQATISDINPVPEPRVITATGGTTVYGRLIRVGGMKPRASVLLNDNNLLYIDITESMAIDLADNKRLYKQVGIEGEATWRVDTWEIVAFKATRITDYQPHNYSLVQTFEALAKEAGDRWNKIDVVAFVNRLRDGGDK